MTTLQDAYAQLDQFAAKHGRKWKEVLMYDYWMKGRPVDQFPLIYGLRNQPGHGPQWLDTYKPAKV